MMFLNKSAILERERLEKGELTDEERDLLAQELRKMMDINDVEEEDSEEENTEAPIEKNLPKSDNTKVFVSEEYDAVETESSEEIHYIKSQIFVNSSPRKSSEDIMASVEVEELPKEIGLVLVRNLPPKLTRNEFYSEISSLPDFSFFKYVMADSNLKFSRAYINFTCPDNIHSFYRTFNNSLFYDNDKGFKYRAKVELAPFCNVLRNKNQDVKYITYTGYMRKVKRRNKIKTRKLSKNEERSKVVSWLASLENSRPNLTYGSEEKIVETKNQCQNSSPNLTYGLDEKINEPKNQRCYQKSNSKAKFDEFKDEKTEKKFLNSENKSRKDACPSSKGGPTPKISLEHKLSIVKHLKGMTIPNKKRSPEATHISQDKKEFPAEKLPNTQISTEPISRIIENEQICGKVDENCFSEEIPKKEEIARSVEHKDRKEPRIRYKDRPSMELYRPGSGKLTKKNTRHSFN